MLKSAAELMKTAAMDWWDDKSPRLAAALAFYTLLSLAPLLILAVSIAGLAVGEDRARTELIHTFQSLVGGQATEVVEAITGDHADRSSSIIGTITGGALLLFGASGVFGELQESLNAIFEVESKPGRGVWGVVRDRLFSFGMVVAVAFMLLVSLVVTATLTVIGAGVSANLPGGATLWRVVDIVVGLVVNGAIFAAIFKVVPDVKIRWRDVLVGAGVTAVLFTIGRLLIGLYLGHSSLGSDYGAAGSLVAVVVWVYYSTNILFLGAEITQAYASRFGSGIEPDKDAVMIPSASTQVQPDAKPEAKASARKATPLAPAVSQPS